MVSLRPRFDDRQDRLYMSGGVAIDHVATLIPSQGHLDYRFPSLVKITEFCQFGVEDLIFFAGAMASLNHRSSN